MTYEDVLFLTGLFVSFPATLSRNNFVFGFFAPSSNDLVLFVPFLGGDAQLYRDPYFLAVDIKFKIKGETVRFTGFSLSYNSNCRHFLMPTLCLQSILFQRYAYIIRLLNIKRGESKTFNISYLNEKSGNMKMLPEVNSDSEAITFIFLIV